MTREELKEHCKKQIEMCEMWAKAKCKNPSGKVYEEHKMILELLEQEPCDDAISRQATIDAVETIGFDFSDSDLSEVELEEVCAVVGDVRQTWLQRIKRLPSVEPERKTGKWIEHKWAEEENGLLISNWECNLCGMWERKTSDFCPSCGAKMEVDG